jgi:hypothetical protein
MPIPPKAGMAASITWPDQEETQARRPAAPRCATGEKVSAEAIRISVSSTRAAVVAVGSIITQIRVMMVIRISESLILEVLAVGTTVFTNTILIRFRVAGMGKIIMALLIIKVDTITAITVVVGEILMETLISIMGAMGIAAMGVMCIKIVGMVGIEVMGAMEIGGMGAAIEVMGVALSEAVVNIIISRVAVIEVDLIRIVIAGRSQGALAISSMARQAIADQFSAAVVIITINSNRAAADVGGMSMGFNIAVGRVVGHAAGHVAAEISTQARGVDAAGRKTETSSRKIQETKAGMALRVRKTKSLCTTTRGNPHKAHMAIIALQRVHRHKIWVHRHKTCARVQKIRAVATETKTTPTTTLTIT